MKQVETTIAGTRLMASLSGETPDILLLHAGGERRHVWRPVQERLARSGISSIAYDQRGHGDSDGAVSDGIEAFAADAAAMLRAHPSIRLVVGGSLGGLSLLLACAEAQIQARLSGLVLVDVVPAPDPDRVRSFLTQQGEGLVQSPLVDSILSKPDLFTDAASQIALPLLLVRAGQHGPMSNAEVRRFRALCPHLRVAHIDTAGHLIARDAPVALADLILDFAQSERVQCRTNTTFPVAGSRMAESLVGR
ncbi:MAG: alpha/beta fold hydrolase [Pseudomonadota bacterium]